MLLIFIQDVHRNAQKSSHKQSVKPELHEKQMDPQISVEVA